MCMKINLSNKKTAFDTKIFAFPSIQHSSYSNCAKAQASNGTVKWKHLRRIIFTAGGGERHNNTADGPIIVCCSTFRGSAGPSWNSSPPPGRRTDSLWGRSAVCIRGQRSSPAGPAYSGADSNSPGGRSADSGSALRRSRGGWTPSWWASRSRRRRRRRKSPVASSCCDPRGCRASVTPAESRVPERGRTMWRMVRIIFLQECARVSCDEHQHWHYRAQAQQRRLWVVFPFCFQGDSH